MNKKFYHCTTIEGFKGICSKPCTHELSLYLSHSQDMNDEKEISFGYKAVKDREKDVIGIERGEKIKDSYIFSVSSSFKFVSSKNDYGSIILEFDKLNDDITFKECRYLTNEEIIELQKKFLEEQFNPMLDLIAILFPFYVKEIKWKDEKEWRIVKSLQENEEGQVRYRKTGERVRYLEWNISSEKLTAVYLKNNVSAEEEREINEILFKYNFGFTAKRI